MIQSVFKFSNGMVAVCDEKGQQLPEYQGTWAEKKEIICRDAPVDAVFEGCTIGNITLDFYKDNGKWKVNINAPTDLHIRRESLENPKQATQNKNTLRSKSYVAGEQLQRPSASRIASLRRSTLGTKAETVEDTKQSKKPVPNGATDGDNIRSLREGVDYYVEGVNYKQLRWPMGKPN